MGVKVDVGNGVEVAVGLGETIGAIEAVGGAEVAGTLVARGEGAGCDVQALKRMSDSVMERENDFMVTRLSRTRQSCQPKRR